MKPRQSESKKKIRLIGFEPDPEVLDMLERAKNAGLPYGEILNEVMRDCGARVIKSMAEKQASKLTSLSFLDAQLLLAGIGGREFGLVAVR